MRRGKVNATNFGLGKNFATAVRWSSLNAVNKARRRLSFVDRTRDGRRPSTLFTLWTYTRQSSVCVLTTRGGDGGRGQVLSTFDNDRHLLITLGCVYSAMDIWRDGVARRPSALADAWYQMRWDEMIGINAAEQRVSICMTPVGMPHD